MNNTPNQSAETILVREYLDVNTPVQIYIYSAGIQVQEGILK